MPTKVWKAISVTLGWVSTQWRRSWHRLWDVLWVFSSWRLPIQWTNIARYAFTYYCMKKYALTEPLNRRLLLRQTIATDTDSMITMKTNRGGAVEYGVYNSDWTSGTSFQDDDNFWNSCNRIRLYARCAPFVNKVCLWGWAHDSIAETNTREGSGRFTRLQTSSPTNQFIQMKEKVWTLSDRGETSEWPNALRRAEGAYEREFLTLDIVILFLRNLEGWGEKKREATEICIFMAGRFEGWSRKWWLICRRFASCFFFSFCFCIQGIEHALCITITLTS